MMLNPPASMPDVSMQQYKGSSRQKMIPHNKLGLKRTGSMTSTYEAKSPIDRAVDIAQDSSTEASKSDNSTTKSAESIRLIYKYAEEYLMKQNTKSAAFNIGVQFGNLTKQADRGGAILDALTVAPRAIAEFTGGAARGVAKGVGKAYDVTKGAVKGVGEFAKKNPVVTGMAATTAAGPVLASGIRSTMQQPPQSTFDRGVSTAKGYANNAVDWAKANPGKATAIVSAVGVPAAAYAIHKMLGGSKKKEQESAE